MFSWRIRVCFSPSQNARPVGAKTQETLEISPSPNSGGLDRLNGDRFTTGQLDMRGLASSPPVSDEIRDASEHSKRDWSLPPGYCNIAEDGYSSMAISKWLPIHSTPQPNWPGEIGPVKCRSWQLWEELYTDHVMPRGAIAASEHRIQSPTPPRRPPFLHKL
jgi:hypothetical protein